VTRLPIRLRLTAAFAVAFVVVLIGAAAFVYTRLDSDLTETVDDGLSTRSAAVAAGNAAAAAPVEAEDGFAQVISPDGAVIDSAGGVRGTALSAAELERALAGTIVFEREVEGIAGEARVLARPGPGGDSVIAVGQSVEDREETLASVLASFAIGGTIALALASLIGYALATAGLAPVEAMRRRAGEVSLADSDELLPLPAANDEIRRLGETLNEMLERLRESFERERQFVADAAHELRTPIAVVRAELDAAVRAPDAGPRARESLGQALAECDRLAALADDLLVLARAADGALPVRHERLDAAAELDATQVRFAERAAAADRTLRVEAPAGLELHADPLRLRQALGNLVDNALRHGRGDVVLRASGDRDLVEIAVSDQGDGFGEGVAESAFERFTRGDEARSGGGAGLGLAIVRTIAEAHGGTAVIADPGRGRVLIRLPARSQGGLSIGS
jgi:two-component system, OmpR family, sensor kinase